MNKPAFSLFLSSRYSKTMRENDRQIKRLLSTSACKFYTLTIYFQKRLNRAFTFNNW